MHIHFIIHESYEGPGAFSQWVSKRGFKQSSTHLYQGESLPATLDFDLLVVLGGPQSPDTSLDECGYFDAIQEANFIKQCIQAEKAVMGVCLGAQLIGEALGVRFEKSPDKEIGYFPITLTHCGKQNNLFKHFKETQLVGHWHNDMPGLLANSKVLAYSEGCPRQIVEYSDLVYGFQCHLEFTKDCLPALIECAFDNTLLNIQPWVQKPIEMMQQSTEEMNELLYQFLDGLVVSYKERL